MPKKVKSFRLQPETEKAIEVMAAKEKRSEAQIIDFAIEEYFTKHFERELEEKMNGKRIYHLKVYRVAKGTDNWPLVEIITGESEQECLDKASHKYDQDEYHWTNPY